MGTPGFLRHVGDDEIKEHLWVVYGVLGQLRRRGQLVAGLEDDDLEQVATIALWEALRRWDPDRGIASTYCFKCVRGSVLRFQRDYTRSVGWHRRRGQIAHVASFETPTGGNENLRLGDTLADQADLVERAHWRFELARIVDRAERMTGRDHVIARVVIGGLPTTRMPSLLGLSQRQASRLRRQVIDNLKRRRMP